MIRKLGNKKKKYTLYLGVDQMALAARLAETSGKSLSSLVGDALHHLFERLELESDSPEIPSDLVKMKERAKLLKSD